VTPSLGLPNQEIQLSSIAVRSTEQSPRNEAVPASTYLHVMGVSDQNYLMRVADVIKSEPENDAFVGLRIVWSLLRTGIDITKIC
jgi:hypothetical protein